MKKPPPGMKSMPVKPGETKSQYMDRVRATKPSGRSPVKPVPPAPTGGGRGGMTPPPGTGGGKPKVSRTPIRPGRPPGFGGMKSGGMVKGKK